MSNHDWVIVYTGGAADTGLLRDLLENAGIPAQLGDEVMGTLAPYVIAGGNLAAIKVVVPSERVDDAREIVTGFAAQAGEAEPAAVAGETAPVEPWECPCCHERNDGWFDVCWNCQTQRL